MSAELILGLNEWSQNGAEWMRLFNGIAETEGKISFFSDEPTLRSYLVTGREVTVPEVTGGSAIRWCTVSPRETGKCKWIAKEALLLGIEPKFTCVETNSTFECLRAISENLADIISIDSNYGHLART